MGFPFGWPPHPFDGDASFRPPLRITETASQTYYASLLTYSGCTTDADLATEVFGGGALDNLTPRQFGSGAAHFIGAVRSIPPADISAFRRPYEVARRLRGHTDSGTPISRRCARWRGCWRSGSGCRRQSIGCFSSSPSVGTARAHCAGPRRRGSLCRYVSPMSPRTPPSNVSSAATSTPSRPSVAGRPRLSRSGRRRRFHRGMPMRSSRRLR